MSEITVDESALKDFRLRARKQYDVEPDFIAVHPQEKTVSGVYEFEMAVRPDKKLHTYFWRFTDTVAGGAFAMDVSDVDGITADEIVNQWLVARKLSVKSFTTAAKPTKSRAKSTKS